VLSGAGVKSQTVLGVPPARLDAALKGVAKKDKLLLRGAKEQQIYATASPSVVLVVTKDGIGSGSVVSATGHILTNWHVVGDERYVAILFKPARDGDVPDMKRAIKGVVVKVDEVADLATIKIAALPAGVKPIVLGDATKVSVGADVHAIGHPIGETWSYTKGLVSQIRYGYEWRGEEVLHAADVIQTQTPISPGNSGGPLLNDDGAIVGVNAFKATEGEALNFAVSVADVRKFFKATKSRFAALPKPATATPPKQPPQPSPACQSTVLKTGVTDTGDPVKSIDLDCDKVADIFVVTPKNPKEEIYALIDADHNGVAEKSYHDKDRDGVWDAISFDEDQDGTIDFVGTDLDESMNPGSVTAAG
jgi:S1-C subfamily serine protease